MFLRNKDMKGGENVGNTLIDSEHVGNTLIYG
jgi:hypothetical protein